MSSNPPDDATLLEWLRDRDAECPLCRYNLRGLTVPRCPECGNAVRLAVALIDPYLKAWIALAAAACAGAGVGVLVILSLWRSSWSQQTTTLKAAFVLYLLMIPAAIAVLGMRRRFQRFSRFWQWLIAAFAILTFVVATALAFPEA